MTKVISLRLPNGLARTVRQNAAYSKMTAADIVRLILEHSLDGNYNFAALPDVSPMDAKLDVRLPEQLVARLREHAKQLGGSVSVYSRVILYAYYTKRLRFIEVGERYTLSGKL